MIGETALTETMIRDQLKKITRSEIMITTAVLTKFLRFVVEETLEGREFEIKEYTIGINVFRRPVTFAPQSDAIVRINAGRLRRILHRYYETTGRFDQVFIDIPKGTYIPLFSFVRQETTTQNNESYQKGLTMGILPFDQDEEITSKIGFDTFTRSLCNCLSLSPELLVISYLRSSIFFDRTIDSRSIGKLLGVHYLVTGSIRITSSYISLSVQLLFTENATIVWTNTYEAVLDNKSLEEICDDLVKQVQSSIGGLNGPIMNHLMHLDNETRNRILDRHSALFWLYLYKKIYTPEILKSAFELVNDASQRKSFYSSSWAVLSQLTADRSILADIHNESDISLAFQMAERAVVLNPDDPHSQAALAYVHLLAGRREDCVAVLNRALSASYCPLGLRSHVFSYLVFAGAYDEAGALIKELPERDLFLTWHFLIARSMLAFYEEDYRDAYNKALQVGENGSYVGPFLYAAAARLDPSKSISATDKKSIEITDASKKARRILSRLILDPKMIDLLKI